MEVLLQIEFSIIQILYRFDESRFYQRTSNGTAGDRAVTRGLNSKFSIAYMSENDWGFSLSK
jgi:hypothetical protein